MPAQMQIAFCTYRISPTESAEPCKFGGRNAFVSASFCSGKTSDFKNKSFRIAEGVPVLSVDFNDMLKRSDLIFAISAKNDSFLFFLILRFRLYLFLDALYGHFAYVAKCLQRISLNITGFNSDCIHIYVCLVRKVRGAGCGVRGKPPLTSNL